MNLHQTAQHCTTQHWNNQHCTTLPYRAPNYTTLSCTVLLYTALNYTTLHSTTLPYNTLHYSTLNYTTHILNYTTLQYTTMHCISYTTSLNFTFTFKPWWTAWRITSTTVVVLPVPGGPWMIAISRCWRAKTTASCWDASKSELKNFKSGKQSTEIQNSYIRLFHNPLF